MGGTKQDMQQTSGCTSAEVHNQTVQERLQMREEFIVSSQTFSAYDVSKEVLRLQLTCLGEAIPCAKTIDTLHLNLLDPFHYPTRRQFGLSRLMRYSNRLRPYLYHSTK